MLYLSFSGSDMGGARVGLDIVIHRSPRGLVVSVGRIRKSHDSNRVKGRGRRSVRTVFSVVPVKEIREEENYNNDTCCR